MTQKKYLTNNFEEISRGYPHFGPLMCGVPKNEHPTTDSIFCPVLTKLALDLHVNLCLCVCVFDFPVFFSRRLIGWYTGLWQWFWHPTYPTRCLELGWAVPHSDFLAWQSSATLKNFISGVSSQILLRWKASLVYSSSRLRRRPEKWRQPEKWRWPQKWRRPQKSRQPKKSSWPKKWGWSE